MFDNTYFTNRVPPIFGTKHCLALGFFLVLCFSAQAQSWNETLRTGDRLFDQARYGEAAEFYEKAWRLRSGKRELMYKAAECYFWAKDYRKAADCYEIIHSDNEEFDLVGLKYARCLKQDGRHYEAKEAFKWFARDYEGPGKKQLDAIIMNDIQGCDFALEAKRKAQNETPKIDFFLLPETINTMEDEFAPVPFTDDLLYFSSNVNNKARIHRSVRQDGQWQIPVEVEGLPMPEGEHIGNGCFSPDGARFYFSECSGAEPGSMESRKGERSKCAILLTRRQPDGAWSTPERLPSYINFSSATATHPYVYEENGKEILIFTSDRGGGLGGLDLYSSARDLNSSDLDFSLPQNLGPDVNTGGDEITPYFDQRHELLYFSSNGLVSMGGMDVFSVALKSGVWQKPENIGLPYNSSADDFGFVLKKSGQGGFLVSNRHFNPSKPSTRHDDLFEFIPRASERPKILAKVFSVEESRTVACSVKLFEELSNGEKRLLTVVQSESGNIELPALRNRTYLLEAAAPGYSTIRVPISQKNDLEYTADLYLQKQNTAFVASEVQAKSPITKRTNYRVQIEAVDVLDSNAVKYNFPKQFGLLKHELIPDQTLYRIMIGDFEDKAYANDIARELRASGLFPQAYVVRYNGAERM